MNARRAWLLEFPWEIVTAQNAVLCQAKNALHKPTSDGHDLTKARWVERHGEVMGLDEAVELCRWCHRAAPFCFFNGNTFVSIVALLIRKMGLPPDQAFVVRSLAGHIVAGVATDLEMKAFREFCDGLENHGAE